MRVHAREPEAIVYAARSTEGGNTTKTSAVAVGPAPVAFNAENPVGGKLPVVASVKTTDEAAAIKTAVRDNRSSYSEGIGKDGRARTVCPGTADIATDVE